MKHKDTISKYTRAKLKMERLKGFYKHLTLYFVINILITGIKVFNSVGDWDAFIADLSSFSTLSSWMVWGVILIIHACAVFVLPKVLGYDWEARKIEQLMEEDLQSKNE